MRFKNDAKQKEILNDSNYGFFEIVSTLYKTCSNVSLLSDSQIDVVLHTHTHTHTIDGLELYSAYVVRNM